MRATIKEPGYYMGIKPSRVTIRQRLSNGQYMSMKFYRRRTKGVLDPEIINVWSVSLYIGGRKAADRWNRGKGKDSGKQTGTGSIEGLRLAENHLLNFAAGFIAGRDELQINFEDAKRGRAYKWLLRHPGFTEYKDKGGLQCIAYRSPEHWEWNDNKEGAGAQ